MSGVLDSDGVGCRSAAREPALRDKRSRRIGFRLVKSQPAPFEFWVQD
ncbi:MAG TPA: hypothetical protein QGF58_27155 [Myxococcota bacterium]|nr:hypothetical protein [Myxococcota bacterium]